MNMIPDAGPPAQPTDVWRIDIHAGTETESVIFNATEADVKAEATRILTEQGGNTGDVYQLTGGDRAGYHTTVPVPLTPWPGLSAADLEGARPEGVTLGDVLAAVVAGVHTERQMADKFGRPLRGPLTRLLCAGLLYMQVIDAEWHYKASKKGREMAKARQGGAS